MIMAGGPSRRFTITTPAYPAKLELPPQTSRPHYPRMRAPGSIEYVSTVRKKPVNMLTGIFAAIGR